jgi:alkylation response protein AidB-like acyl-CoA dehydrogenase
MTTAAAFDADTLRQAIRVFLAEHSVQREVSEGDAWRDAEQEELDALHDDEARALKSATEYQRALFEAGLAGLTWPAEHGGRGLSSDAQTIFQEEAAAYAVPRVTFGVAINMVGPVIIAHGTTEQRDRHLPAILNGEETWCQLFSEPGAGSDLAGLRTRAVRDGDELVVNGQKVWTSGAQYADFGLLLARTDIDAPKHRGITAIVLDMHTPGVTVRPLRQMSGVAHFNEVFLDDVRIPIANVLAGLGDGWRVAITTLMHERGAGTNKRADYVGPVIEQARSRGLAGDRPTRQRLADLWIRGRVLELMSDRVMQQRGSGEEPGPHGSLLKLLRARLAKDAAEIGMTLAGPGGVAWLCGDNHDDRWVEALLATRRLSIAGGTDEIQRNIIGERILGLPKEPSNDRTKSFRDLLANG